MIPTQLCQVKTNVGFAPDFGIFEIGRVVTGMTEDDLVVEKKKLAVTLYSKTQDVKTLYFALRDMLAVIADDVKHTPLTFAASEPAHAFEHPVNRNTILMNGTEIGMMGIVHPEIGRKIDKKAAIVFAEIDMQAFGEQENASILYAEPSKFPPMDYDLSVVVPKGVLFADMRTCWENEGAGILRGVRIVDSYDTSVFHSETMRFEFSSNERTLSSAEVQEIMNRIIENLKAINVTLR